MTARAHREIDWGQVRAAAFERLGARRLRRGERALVEAALSGRDAVGVLPDDAARAHAVQLLAAILPGEVVERPAERLAGDGGSGAPDDREVSLLVVADAHRGSAADVPSPSTDGDREARETTAALSQVPSPPADGDEGARETAAAPSEIPSPPAERGERARERGEGGPPILALVPPAPPEAAAEASRRLGLLDPVVSRGVERGNLFLEVRECPEASDKEAVLLEALRAAPGAAVVLCATPGAATEVHERLHRAGVAAELFHARRRGPEREAARRRFLAGEVRVAVATSASGASVDRPDLRLVVHWNFPDSVETYEEETGRAGRDGLPARALLLYRPDDRRIQRASPGGRTPAPEALRAIWAVLERAGTHPTPVKKLAADAGLIDRHAQETVSLLRSLGLAEKRGGGFRRTRSFASAEELSAFLSGHERRAELDRERLRAIVRYAQTALCRAQALRVFFGEETGRPCGHCDNCRDRPQVVDEVLRAEAAADARPGLG